MQKKAVVFCSGAKLGHRARTVTVEITPPNISTLFYHQVEDLATPASCPLLPPPPLEHVGATLYTPLISMKLLFGGWPRVQPYMCPEHIPYVPYVIMYAECVYMWR